MFFSHPLFIIYLFDDAIVANKYSLVKHKIQKIEYFFTFMHIL